MVFQKVEVNAWKFNNTGDEIIGTLAAVRDDVGINKARVYDLQISDVLKVSVWGSTVLNEKMHEVKIGQLIKIIYLGKKKNYHNFDVFIDDGQPEQLPQTT